MATELLPAKLSGDENASKQIVTGPCCITCLGVFTNGVDDFSVTLYDNTAASGKKIWKTYVKGSDYYGGRLWVPAGEITNGIYAEVAGSNGWFVVEYVKM